VRPGDFGLSPRPLSALAGGDAAENATATRSLLSGGRARPAGGQAQERYHTCDVGAAADVVALNAGCALYVGGVTASWSEGVERARELISRGAGALKLEEWIRVSRALAEGAGERAAEDASGEDQALHETPRRST
jgi:anthranilate phosphoribosyltransferase